MDIILDSIQIKRGSKANLPVLKVGEPALCTDTGEIAIGTNNGNIYINFSTLEMTRLKRLGINANGNLTIDGNELVGGAGTPGKSAYQLWLDQGNTGTVQQFLASLVGPQGPAGTGGSGSGTLVYNTLAELQAAYPNGTTQPVWIVADNAWYYWSGTVTPPADTTAPTLTITAGGTFTGTKTVTLTSSETGTIYYTLDGTTPTTASTVYSGPLSVTATTTLKAFAKDNAGNSSAIQTVTYTLGATDTTAPTVTASPATGTYTSAQNVTLTANETATIYYTTDGTTPTTSSAVYSGPINISSTTTLQYIGRDSAGNTSAPVVSTYTINIPVDTTAPVLTITPAATFTDTQTVIMSTNEMATIWYTLDDTDPTISGTRLQYSAPLTLTATETVKAYAVDSANNASPVQTVTYTKQTAPTGGYVANGLQLYYDFEGLTSTPTIVSDSSGNGRDGTLNGYAGTATSGVVGGELIGDGTGDYILIPSSTTLKTYPFTLETYARFYNRASSPPTSARLFDVGQYGGTGTGSGVNVYVNNASNATPNVIAINGSLGQPAVLNASVPNLFDNTYRHIAIVFAATSQKIYVNGALVASQNSNAPATLGTKDIGLFGLVGTSATGDTLAHGAKFFRFYNKELTQSEVTQNYNDAIA
jgi:hypothetical protein